MLDLKVRESSDGLYGFVEEFKTYKYNDQGYVEVTGVIGKKGIFDEPYVYRSGSFIPLIKIDEEYGISAYLQAKKPFYSILSPNSIVIRAKLWYDINKGILEEKSEFDIYKNMPIQVFDRKDGYQDFSYMKENLITGPLKEKEKQIEYIKKLNFKLLYETLGNREDFLRRRFV